MRKWPAELWGQAEHTMAHPVRAIERRPYRSGGVLLLLLAAVGLAVWVGPELRRYIRMERM